MFVYECFTDKNVEAIFNYKTPFLGLFKCFEPFPRATNLPVRAFFTRSNHSGTLRHFLLLRAFFTCNRSATSRHFHTAIILFLASFFRAWYLCPF